MTGKIFQIGFNRCGTNNLAHFFHRNGYPAVHWDCGKLAESIVQNDSHGWPMLTDYEGFRFFSDMENAHRNFAHVTHYQKLDAAYPGSRFILNVRDLDRWIESRVKLDDGKYLGRACSFYGMSEFDVKKLWRVCWGLHVESIRQYFQGRASSLLTFDIERDSGSKLSAFFADLDLDPALWGHHSLEFFLRTDVVSNDGAFYGFSGPQIRETRYAPAAGARRMR